MHAMRERMRRRLIRLYSGDLGVNQSAEVGGLVGVAVAVTAAVATKGPDIADSVVTFITDKLGG